MTHDNPGAEPDLLQRYLAGDLAYGEAQLVEEWLTSNPAAAEIVRSFVAGAVRVPGDVVSPSAAEMLAGVRRGRDAVSEVPASTTREGVQARPALRRISGMRAASAWNVVRWTGIAVASAVVAVFLIPHPKQVPAPPPPDRTYTTTVRQSAMVELADGSRVKLAPQTTLTIAGTFGKVTRTVTLTGEAFFDVAPDNRVPFVVHAGNVATRVLGTSFDVKHYAEEPAVRIVVATGKVQSGAASRPAVILTAGMIARVTDSTTVARMVADVSGYTSWTNGHLDFYGTPVPEVLETLSRWYGIEFRLADSSLSRATVTGRFDYDYSSTTNVMTTLKTLLGVTLSFERAGDTTIVTLHPRSSGAHRAPTHHEAQDSLATTTEVGL